MVSASSCHQPKFSIVDTYKPFLLYTNYYHPLGQVAFPLTPQLWYHMNLRPTRARAAVTLGRTRADELTDGIPEAANNQPMPGQSARRPAGHACPNSRHASTPPELHQLPDSKKDGAANLRASGESLSLFISFDFAFIRILCKILSFLPFEVIQRTDDSDYLMYHSFRPIPNLIRYRI